MKEVIVALDGSLRSSGIVVTDLEGNIVSMLIIDPKSGEYDDEVLLEKIRDELVLFLTHLRLNDYTIRHLFYERAAFSAASSTKDKLAGSFWLNRIALRDLQVPWSNVSVGTWRKDVLNKEDRKRIKDEKIKHGLKLLAIEKLPAHVRERMDAFVKARKHKASALEDLCDAYWLAQWGVKNLPLQK